MRLQGEMHKSVGKRKKKRKEQINKQTRWNLIPMGPPQDPKMHRICSQRALTDPRISVLTPLFGIWQISLQCLWPFTKNGASKNQNGVKCLSEQEKRWLTYINKKIIICQIKGLTTPILTISHPKLVTLLF